MIFGKYIAIKLQYFQEKEFLLRPIEFADRTRIMKWRNEQLYHLRQKNKLTKKQQDFYFINEVAPLFRQKHPKQLLFSLDFNETHVAYGGLVHIDLIKKNAELSFVMDTRKEKKHFESYWKIFLKLIEKIAHQLQLKLIYTAAFDLRPKLYDVLEDLGYESKPNTNLYTKFESTEEKIIVHAKDIFYEKT
tara:strand:- start:781 stop:1350 length:570 start_codon:yes stop_codon:yes gene_type:complete